MTVPYFSPVTPSEIAMMAAGVPRFDGGRLVRAYRFAEAAHDGQMRDEGTPYIEHPIRVALILWEELGVRDVDMLVAALNHDVLEDCDWLDAGVLEGALGERPTGFIQDVTKPRVPDAEKAQRDQVYLDGLPKLCHESRLIKLADRIDNLRGVIHAGDPAKAGRYLDVSRRSFIPLALATEVAAADLIAAACDHIEAYLRESGSSS